MSESPSRRPAPDGNRPDGDRADGARAGRDRPGEPRPVEAGSDASRPSGEGRAEPRPPAGARAATGGGPGTLPNVPGYRIGGVLGRGSTGVVYRATQLAVDRPVALKVLHPSVSRTRVVRRLQREARTTARLSHPNIVAAIDMGSLDGVWWYAMELVEGPSLAARLQREERLTERAALRLFIPLCEALVHLHQHGVVHRDIKPANILVDQSGRARLVDLGLAFAEDDPALTVQGGTLGTPHYVSPEQARNAGDADVRSDIWSLGASLFHTVTGRPPFSGSNVAEIISAVLYARVPDPGELAPELSRGMRLVLRKCLARSPERRYQTPEDLLEDFERLRERRQVAVQRGELDPVAGSEDRVRRLKALAGVAVTAGLLALAWFSAPDTWLDPDGPGENEELGLELEAAAGELEALAARPRSERRGLAAALGELDVLRDELAPSLESRWRAVRADFQRRYNDTVDQLRSEFLRDLSQALERRDFVQARALVETGLEATLELELSPSPDQMKALRQQFEQDRRLAEVQAAEGTALRSVDVRLRSYLKSTVLGLVEAQQRQQRWRSARDSLRVSPQARLAEARIDVSGLPEEAVTQRLDAVRAELLDPALDGLEAAWVRTDRELGEWIDERGALLRTGLEQRSKNGTPMLLQRDWDEHLVALGLAPDEMLTELADTARPRLAARMRELGMLEEQLLREDADRILSERVERLEPRWSERHYAELAEIWRTALELPYLEPQKLRLEGLLLEAELLDELLARAAKGLERLAESEAPALFVVGSIGVEGELALRPDFLTEGFVLLPNTSEGDAVSEIALSLRAVDGAQTLVATDLERLADLGSAADGANGAGGAGGGSKGAPSGVDPSVAGARDRLTRALFRWREGDFATAAGLLPVPALGDPNLERLAADLVRRVGRSLEARDVDREARLEEARSIERLINRVIRDGDVHPRDVEETIGRIDRFLADYADLEYVRRREPEMRYLRSQLSDRTGHSGAAEFKTTFGADSVELDTSERRVEMGFVFDETSWGGPWSHGDWVVAGQGWEAPGISSRDQLLHDPRWPRLVLRTPLDLDQPMSVELDVHQPRASGRPQLLIASVAGVHVAFAGPQDGTPARLSIRSGGTERIPELLTELLDGTRGEPAPGLARGQTHRIRIVLTRGRGRAEVYLDDVMIGQEDRPRPSGAPGSASVVLRSIEPVRLESARISAGYRAR